VQAHLSVANNMSDTSARKRKKDATTIDRATKNPLAAARKGHAFISQNHGGRFVDPNDDFHRTRKANFKISNKAEQLWHKRSGAGLDLFVEYYCGQPKGVVVSDSKELTSSKIANSTRECSKEILGMSRATQRRRKKRKQTKEECHSLRRSRSHSSCTEPTSSQKVAESFFTPRHLYGDQLLSILESKIHQNKHIAKQIQTNPQAYKSFFGALSTSLPLTFRLRRSLSLSDADCLRKKLQGPEYSSHIQPTAFDPDIYHAHKGLDKVSLPKVCPALKELLNRHSGDASIARQEIGSMLPVWLLERTGVFDRLHKSAQGCRVLDMCASPGSKTLQALELNLLTSGGTVRANDINESRLQALKDAVWRSGIPGADKLVKYANFDASLYPIPKTEAKKYHIVLCDVPCSGDGTSRKDPHIIPNWLPTVGNNLHPIQTQILLRALQCVTKDGVVSYSTCSMNPVEDEAVVAAALAQIQIVNPSLAYEIMKVAHEQLNGLVLHPGITTWRVADYYLNEGHGCIEIDEDGPPKLVWYASYQDAVSGQMDGACKSMWPTRSTGSSDVCNSSLSRCYRLFPQDQNTGGFFVALIKRIK
jgi:tRNA (cytosine34-C5)-methyltransferase